MPDYRIFETGQFSNDLKKLAKSSLPHIENKIKRHVYPQLKKEPHYGLNIKKLKGYSPSTWRYRVGDWRFFYEIDEERKIVFMITIHHRGHAY